MKKHPQIQQLLKFVLVTADAEKLAHFYERALSFRRAKSPGHDATEGASVIQLTLGGQSVELLQFDPPGQSYPNDVKSSDIAFQHLALIVDDMAAAYRQLQALDGWTSISTDGPQLLPPASGGVTAFKFRDPEGHPLELLQFPDGYVPDYWQNKRGRGLFLGIDHSAISVADAGRSVAFYESMGLTVSQRSVNHGPEQGQLDHLDQPVVEVITMSPLAATPHVELLCYRQARDRSPIHLQPNDVAATCLVFAGKSEADAALTLRDPDGHHGRIEPLEN